MLQDEIRRRRTFAIISHPDAGKTTLTEKFLLYAGCIEIAGSVRGRKTERSATSDWMELERERGISISSTALSFEFRNHVVNLLDTPGHQDFSEDTYRTLAAADSAVMVIDAAKGIEKQTRKLFQVCAVRKIPILTFINKMDRMGRPPLDLLGEIEQLLGIDAIPLNWPIGLGEEFTGVFDCTTNEAHLFDTSLRGALRVPTTTVSADDLADRVGDRIASRCLEELELLAGAGVSFDPSKFLTGEQTPVFFGSAMTNYGIEHFFEAFLRLAPPPGARRATSGLIPPDRESFAGIVFKIQANLNPRHRDRVAFVRVCSGVFTQDCEPRVARTGAKLRVRGSHRLFARDRAEVQEAFPGDVIGMVFTNELRLSDTICEGDPVEYERLPQFSPECFALVKCLDTARRKQLAEGLTQLCEEGAIQLFQNPENVREPILAAVGELQFDVVQFRLQTEYNVKAIIEKLPLNAAAWVRGDSEAVRTFQPPNSAVQVFDHRNRPVLLVEDDWHLNYLMRQYPDLTFTRFSEELFLPND